MRPSSHFIRYYLQFEARMGMRIFSDVAIDDFSLSPECFGLNIPQEHLQGYNYWDPRIFKHKIPHADFVNKTGESVFFFCFVRPTHCTPTITNACNFNVPRSH